MKKMKKSGMWTSKNKCEGTVKYKKGEETGNIKGMNL